MGEPQAKPPPNSSPAQDLTGTAVGRFLIRERLGGGGMGEVYRADDTQLNCSVALKRVAPRLRADPRYRERLLKEAARASRLRGEAHIATIFDVLEQNGEIFLVMEYVEGETLRQRLRRPLGIEPFLEIAVQCAEALVAAHQRSLVHRDIKPENIMLTAAGQVKILDFGVAKRLPRREDASTLETVESSARGVSGTSGYIAPEILLEKDSDGRADVFSLGVVFYEALTGRHPFPATGFLATADQVLHATPLRPTLLNPRVPAELERIVWKMLAKRPEERHATAADLLVDLRALQRTLTRPGLLPLPRPEPPARALRPWLWRGVTLGIIVVLAASVVPLVREQVLCWAGWCPVPEEKNLVVLPFRAVGGSANDQIYCDGFTHTVTAQLTQLTRLPHLQVASASEVQAAKVWTPEQARTELGANLVLEGSWQRMGDTVRINLVLVETQTKSQLRSETITVKAADLLALQDRVAHTAAAMLDLTLQPEQARELARASTASPSAYDFYLQGRGYLQNYDKLENIESAISLFQRALELDPKYGRAHAALGEAYWKKYEATREAQWIEAARQACQQAASLEPKLAETHICLGTLYSGTGEYAKGVEKFQLALESELTSDDAYRGLAAAYERLGKLREAEETYRRSIQLRPHYWAGYSWLGAFYAKHGRYPEAAEQFEQARKLAPDNALVCSNLGGVYYFLGRWDDAIAMYQESIALRPNYRAYNNLAGVHLSQGRYEEAARTYEQALKLDGSDYRVWASLAASYESIANEQQKAAAAYREAIARAEQQLQINPRDPHVLAGLAKYHAALGEASPARQYVAKALGTGAPTTDSFFLAALVYERLGERKRALESLRRALEGGLPREEVEHEPWLAPLRQDKRFQELMRELLQGH